MNNYEKGFWIDVKVGHFWKAGIGVAISKELELESYMLFSSYRIATHFFLYNIFNMRLETEIKLLL